MAARRGRPSVRADDGTRTHDLLHANASDRSRPFAPVRSNDPLAGFPWKRANGSEPERTSNLAILATESGSEPGLGELPGDPLTHPLGEAGADLICGSSIGPHKPPGRGSSSSSAERSGPTHE